MRTLVRNRVALAFAASFLTVGIPYWMIPFGSDRFSLPEALIGPGLIVVILAALALRALRTASFVKVTCVLGSSVPAAAFARVAEDVVKDPTSHNLWPFEIAIALPIGFGCALAGAVVGSLFAFITAERGQGENR
ncbi:MAG: hypothetical protein IRY91_03265 [Gemmatimonadaceae bacterium]|nr:hypothetical protein [Gemmatimonadaceae bacterium]